MQHHIYVHAQNAITHDSTFGSDFKGSMERLSLNLEMLPWEARSFPSDLSSGHLPGVVM